MDEKTEIKANVVKPGRTYGDVIDALAEWIIRVADDKTASDKEIEMLPDVVCALINFINRGKRYH